MRICGGNHRLWGRYVEASKLDIPTQEKTGISGNAVTHRLGDRPDSADRGDA